MAEKSIRMTPRIGVRARRPTRPHLRVLAAFCLAALALVLAASPASAHTRLLSSSPDDRSSLEEAPELLTLTFAEAVDPRSVQLDIISLGGEVIPGGELLSPLGGELDVITFALPELPDGVYGLAWVTVGPDGHRVAGEVVLGVGVASAEDVAGASFQSTPLLDRALTVVSAAARYVWYLGLALVAGALFVLYTTRRRRGAQAHAGGTEAGELLALHSRRALIVGSIVAHLGIAIRTGATIFLVTRGFDSGSLLGDLRLALLDGMGLLMLGSTVAAGTLVLWAPRLARASNPLTFLQAGLGVMAMIAAGVANSHTAVFSEGGWGWTGTWVSTLHLSASSLWLGPLLIVGWAAARPRWRSLAVGERSGAVRTLFGKFAPVAVVSFLILALTGLRSTLLLAGREILSSGYGVALLVKIGLVALVALPLALHNDWNLGFLARRRSRPAGISSHRSIRLEALTLGLVIATATIVVGMNPSVFSSGGSGGPGDPVITAEEIEAALSDAPPSSVDECAERTVGKANCYRTYFAEVMRQEGADVAVAEVDRLRETDDFIARDCHQVVHDLGNDAAAFYGDIGTALTYEGSPCWSGYYHGVVEYAISQFKGRTLYEELPDICATAAEVRYSFTHYNCVHGLGHGVMLNLDGDLFGSLEYCEALTDRWEMSSCVSGSFMENVTATQQGVLTKTALSEEDLVYPCNAVKDDFVDECFGMQTSWMLSQIGYADEDFATVFEICDTLREDMIGVCYQSMGRDISGSSLLEVDRVLRLCSLGDPDYQERCWVGASLNAVYSEHDPAKATELCARVPQRYKEACYAARDRAAATFA